MHFSETYRIINFAFQPNFYRVNLNMIDEWIIDDMTNVVQREWALPSLNLSLHERYLSEVK